MTTQADRNQENAALSGALELAIRAIYTSMKSKHDRAADVRSIMINIAIDSGSPLPLSISDLLPSSDPKAIIGEEQMRGIMAELADLNRRLK